MFLLFLPHSEPYGRVINIRILDWKRIGDTNYSTLILGWSPIKPEDTGCDYVDRYIIRIYDKHPSVVGAWPIRNLTVAGHETNVTITRMIINKPYYTVVSYKNNEQIDSSPSDLIPIRVEPEAAQASTGSSKLSFLFLFHFFFNFSHVLQCLESI